MHVRNYISAILLTSVLGALALALTVGLGLSAERNAILGSGQASEDFRNVRALSSESNELLAVFDILTTEQSGVLVIADRLVAQCHVLLEEISTSETFADAPELVAVVDSFEQMIAEGQRASLLGKLSDQKAAQLDRYDVASAEYLDAIEALEAMSVAVAKRQVRALADQSRRNKVVIATLSILFVFGVLAIRSWITARLVRPLDDLNRAAEESMTNGREFVLKETGPAEIRSLTSTIKSFVGSLEAQIRSRTNDLEVTNSELDARMEQAEEMSAQLRCSNTALEKSQREAIQSSKAKTEFLANMSHEIRTPMTSILGFSENLREGGLSAEDERDAIATIHTNGEYLLGIINDILDMSKIEAGKITMEHIDCTLVTVVDDVLKLLRPRAAARNLTLDAEIVGTIPEVIRTDPTRVKQILINIAGNAVKFTESGGVRIQARFLDHGAASQMQFDVVDSGIGMTSEQTQKLFRAFAQADSTTTRKFGGTGLGLAISKRFAELLGGDLAIVESEPGVGTRLRLTVGTGPVSHSKMIDRFPVAPGPTPDERPTDNGPAKPLHACRMLLVEDGPDNQRLISYVLKKAGADVTVLENGKLALDAALAAVADASPFDCILMDMQMPVMDGYEATARLRDAGYALPIVALTAHAMASDRQKCIDAGCSDYATKPIDRVALIETIRRNLTRAETDVARVPQASA